MGNGALPNGPSYRAYPRLYPAAIGRLGSVQRSTIRSLARARTVARVRLMRLRAVRSIDRDTSEPCGKFHHFLVAVFGVLGIEANPD
jgi:hypothetical protein